jgi:hypothetical protein
VEWRRCAYRCTERTLTRESEKSHVNQSHDVMLHEAAMTLMLRCARTPLTHHLCQQRITTQTTQNSGGQSSLVVDASKRRAWAHVCARRSARPHARRHQLPPGQNAPPGRRTSSIGFSITSLLLISTRTRMSPFRGALLLLHDHRGQVIAPAVAHAVFSAAVRTAWCPFGCQCNVRGCA